MITGTAFLFGLIVGSFLNVCIARLPEGSSIASPPSHCPRCKTPIRWYDNIPLVSYLLLRGRCRSCGKGISLRYPLVELLNGLLFMACAFRFGVTGEAVLMMALGSSLLVITFIDIDHQIIPDVITLPGMALGLLLGPFFMTPLAAPLPFDLLHFAGSYVTGLANSVLGLLLGGVPLWLIGWVWEKLRKVEAMGGGDVKLMAMVGSLFGWQGAFLTILLGAFAGSAVGILLIAAKKHRPENVIPFGPFLAAGAFLTMFFGPDLKDWYFGMFGL